MTDPVSRPDCPSVNLMARIRQSDSMAKMKEIPRLPEPVEMYRDCKWRREPELRIEDAFGAEKFIEDIGFCGALTDSRRLGPSIYIGVCGRRDAHMPRNVQKDPECSLAWTIKDEVMRRGRVYYGKLLRGRTTFIARRLIPHFHVLWGVRRQEESLRLSRDARAVLSVLRSEWEMASRDLRQASGIGDRTRFNRAIDELQKTFKVIPSDVIYDPVFTYIWSLTEARFLEELKIDVTSEEALKEIARAYLTGAGMTVRRELASVTGLSAPDAGLGNWALVDEGLAVRLSTGVYRLRDLA